MAGNVVQLKITLKEIHPPVWRRVLVSEEATLRDLHGIIQTVFGWWDYHLHEFEIRGASYSDPASDEFGELNFRDDRRTKLKDFALRPGDKFLYRYDFGDDWEHIVKVEGITPKGRGMRLPQCTGGKRSRPPEDVGGVGGYGEFLEAISDPAHAEHEEYCEWAGGSFDPEAFNLEAVAQALRQSIGGGWGANPAPPIANSPEPPAEGLVVPAPAVSLGSEHGPACEGLALRRDLVAMLGYLRDNKVTGTTATGNFPRKAVEGIAARMCVPPVLEHRIGDHVYRFQSEDDVWAVYFLHMMADAAQLITGGRSRRWRLTTAGEQFLRASPVDQVWALFAVWWYGVDWLIAVPTVADEEQLPVSFAPSVRTGLMSIPNDTTVDFAPFAEGVVEATGWRRTQFVNEHGWELLIRIVRQAVVEPLEQLGLLEGKLTTIKHSWGETKELTAFRVTPLGRALLSSLT